MNLKNFCPTFILLLGIGAGSWFQPLSAQPVWNLEKCLRYATEHNEELDIERNRGALAVTETGDSKARLLPTISAAASLDHYWQIPVQVFPGELTGQPQGTFIPVRLGTPWMGNASLQAEMPLIDASSWQQVKISMLEQQLKAHEMQSAQQLIAKNVRMSYYSVLLNAEQRNVANARVQDFEESCRLIKLNFEKGLTDQIAVNQSLALLKDLSDDAERIQASCQQSLLDLKFWMGYPLSEPIKLDSTDLTADQQDAPSQFSIQRLPDFAKDSLTALTAAASLRHARAFLYPKLTVVSGYSRLGFGSEFSFITRSKWFSSGFVGLRFSMPLLDLSCMHYQIRRERENLKLAVAKQEANAQAGAKSFMIAKLRHSRASQQVAMLNEKRMLAQQNVGLADKKLEKGIIDMVQLKQVHDELTLIQREQLAAKLQMLVEMVELEYLQGN
nr:TolC family protein [uncultured Dyadobacter sp.]